MKYLLVLLTMVSFSTLTYSQKVDSEQTLDCIKSSVVSFFQEAELLEKGPIEDYFDNIIVTEILEKKRLGYNINGIYFIGVHISHRPFYLLIKKGAKHKILNLKNLSTTLNDLSYFLQDLGTDRIKTLDYLRLSIELIQKNQNLPKTGTIIVEQEWKNCKI